MGSADLHLPIFCTEEALDRRDPYRSLEVPDASPAPDDLRLGSGITSDLTR